MSVRTIAAANFKRSRLIVLYKEINVQGRLGLNLKKSIGAFRFYNILNFSKKGIFAPSSDKFKL